MKARAVTVRSAILAAAALTAIAGCGPPPGTSAPRSGARAAAPHAPASRVPDPPASLAGAPDEGVFRLYANEELLATGRFRWSADGAYESDCDLSLAGQTVSSRFELRPDSSGAWTHINLTSSSGRIEVSRDGPRATVTRADRVETVEIPAGARIWENYNPALVAATVRTYDRIHAGRQRFPVFIVPSAVMEASLEYLGTVSRALATGEVELDVRLERYAYRLPGVTATFYMDTRGRVILVEVPAQHETWVREGYEALLAPQASPGADSAPSYEVSLTSTIEIPMRDGVRLAADLYLPRGAARSPVILARTPYKKEMQELQARFYARRGYAYVAEDCRGRFASPGEWEPFMHEAADGYDTIEWLAAQPWSTGKVGMIGASYLGWAEWWAARDRPPHLAAMIPSVSPPDPFFNIPYDFGCFYLTGAIWWAEVLESEATADLSGEALLGVEEKPYQRLLRALPVVDLDLAVLGHRNRWWREWIEHPDDDAWWAPADFRDRIGGLDIPVFHQSGWFDGDGIGTKLNYLAAAPTARAPQKLILGPWGHTDTATRSTGFRDFGDAAIVDLQREYLRWMDRWLKGIPNGIDHEPLVSIFVMGSNRWLHADRYPLPETRFTPLYLASGGHANTSGGDGRLNFEAPEGAQAASDAYRYDPGDPTPSPYWPAASDSASAPQPVEEERRELKAYPAKLLAGRPDILVYRTGALARPLTFAGPIEAVLFAATSARDTDWFMRVSDVDSTGEVFELVEGKIRARFRDSFRDPAPLEPDRIYEYRLDLWQCGITIPAGHRLSVEVASASFPAFSRNLNTGGHNETETAWVAADQRIFHDAAHPSRVILPVIDEQ